MLGTKKHDLKAAHHLRRASYFDLVLFYHLCATVTKQAHTDLHIPRIVGVGISDKAVILVKLNNVLVISLSETLAERGHIDGFQKICLSLSVFTDKNVGAFTKINVSRIYISKIFNVNISAKHLLSFYIIIWVKLTSLVTPNNMG
jgi:hypothetical protein